ncbi:MAG TPA: class I SAM-dependent methyltransferase [Planctomycetota bacterium]|nr:class I SAM-dependent methyltransferase [Planctomycetota bacterium]
MSEAAGDERRHAALVALGRHLRRGGYRFTTITPESHRRVVARQADADARDLRDVFGWSRPFRAGTLDREAERLLGEAGCLRRLDDGRCASAVRWSTIGDALHLHSAYPTREADAVFLGPDTYRFVAALRALAPSARRVVDIGCGSGAGGLALSATSRSIVLADVNPRALAYARVTAELAGVAAELVESDVLDGVAGAFDLVVANPPYLVDGAARRYRDGGGDHGGELSLRIAAQALRRLDRGGRLILYTASAIIAGRDVLGERLTALARAGGADCDYRELDPDVFGEELETAAYADVERIAVVLFDARLP